MRRLFAAGAVLCMVAAIRLAAAAAAWYPAVGLRFAQPLTRQQVLAVQEYTAARAAEAEPEEALLCPTFWQESQLTVSAAYAQADMTVIGCLGDAAQVWPADFIAGGWPGVKQADACALSDAAAWTLFGSTDVVGQTVKCAGRACCVTGVFSEKTPLCLYTAAADAGFTAVELAGACGSDTRAAAQNFAAAAGLGTPASIVCGPDMAEIERLTARLPLVVAGVALFVWIVLCGRLWRAPRRGIFCFSLLFVLAVLLPGFLAALPGWAVPAQWSDFAFWGRLVQAAGARIREWLALTPCQKDIAAKLAILRLVGCTGLSLGLEGIWLALAGQIPPPAQAGIPAEAADAADAD